MNIEMSSSARLPSTGNRGRSVNRRFMRVKERLERVNYLENWRKFVLSACVIALAIDPLFLFVPVINSVEKCFAFDNTLGVVVSAIRSVIDTFYVFHFMVYFIIELAGTLNPSQNKFRGELSVHAKTKRRIPLYLFVDVLSVLPFPQVLVVTIIYQSYAQVSKSILISFTKWIIVGQYIPRIIRIYPLYKEVTRTSGTISESSWIGAALNLLVFMLCSYVSLCNCSQSYCFAIQHQELFKNVMMARCLELSGT